jgi:hypothetical protein
VARPLPAYPPCTGDILALVCKRVLVGDVFVIEVGSVDQGAHEFVARFRATSF